MKLSERIFDKLNRATLPTFDELNDWHDEIVVLEKLIKRENALSKEQQEQAEKYVLNKWFGTDSLDEAIEIERALASKEE